jgi:hypothetical protein
MSKGKSTSIRLLFVDAVVASTVDTSAKAVALVLFRHMDSSGRAWPGKETIAAGAGLTKRPADNAILRLEAAGLITVTRSNGRLPNLYRVSPTVLHAAGSTVRPATGLDDANPAADDAQPCGETDPTLLRAASEAVRSTKTQPGWREEKSKPKTRAAR